MTRARLDRLMTLCAVHPFRRLVRATPGIPVLMYHSVSVDSMPAGHGYYGITTSPEQFDQQIRMLRREGFSDMAFCDLAPETVASRQVVITFDDGYRDNLTAAWPILRAHGFTATIFLASDFVGKSFKDRACLSWDDVRQMRKEGAVFGSHTASHPELVTLGDAEIEREWKTSKKAMEEQLGEEIRFFSYPYAFPETNRRFVERLKGILQKLGFEKGVTTALGTVRASSDPFFLPRLPVNSFDDARLFAAKLGGSYDWMHGPQRLYKQAKSAFGASRRG